MFLTSHLLNFTLVFALVLSGLKSELAFGESNINLYENQKIQYHYGKPIDLDRFLGRNEKYYADDLLAESDGSVWINMVQADRSTSNKNYIALHLDKKGKLIERIEQAKPIPPKGIKPEDGSYWAVDNIHYSANYTSELFNYTRFDRNGNVLAVYPHERIILFANIEEEDQFYPSPKGDVWIKSWYTSMIENVRFVSFVYLHIGADGKRLKSPFYPLFGAMTKEGNVWTYDRSYDRLAYSDTQGNLLKVLPYLFPSPCLYGRKLKAVAANEDGSLNVISDDCFMKISPYSNMNTAAEFDRETNLLYLGDVVAEGRRKQAFLVWEDNLLRLIRIDSLSKDSYYEHPAQYDSKTLLLTIPQLLIDGVEYSGVFKQVLPSRFQIVTLKQN